MPQEDVVSLDDKSYVPRQRGREDINFFRFTEQDVKDGRHFRIRMPSMTFVLRVRHAHPVQKKYVRCLSHTGYCPVCAAIGDLPSGKAGSDEKKRREAFFKEHARSASDAYGVVVFNYTTNADGDLLDSNGMVIDENNKANASRITGKCMLLKFGNDKFLALRNLKRRWGDLTTVDLDILPKDHNFQDFEIDVLPPEALRPGANSWPLTQEPSVAALVHKETGKFRDLPIEKFLCKDMDVPHMVDFFNLDPSYARVPVSAEIDPQGSAESAASRAKPAQVIREPEQPPDLGGGGVSPDEPPF